MKFALMVWHAADGRRLYILLTLAVIMISTVGILVIISEIVTISETGTPGLLTLVLFVGAAVGLIGGHSFGQRTAAAIVESQLDQIRRQLASRVRQVEYNQFEDIGSTRIYDVLTRNSAIVSEASMLVFGCFAAIGSLVFGGLYTLILSPLVFFTMLAVMLAGMFFFRMVQRGIRLAMVRTGAAETGFLSLFAHLLHGFKEVRLHRPRGDSLERDRLVPASLEMRDIRVEGVRRINGSIIVSLSLFYVNVTVIAFLLPPFLDDLTVVAKAIYVALFLLSAVDLVARALPLLQRAGMALDELDKVQDALAAHGVAGDDDAPPPDFARIDLERISFNYRDPDGTPVFSIGPLSLSIARGETLFIVGGYGSGKSTFLKVLTRLYVPDNGTISVDGRVLEPAAAPSYRALFSAVFADFHLFDRLYGLEDRTPEQVNGLLDELGIGNKLRSADGRFSTTDLSTGQRKRIAFAVALLEERPILVLDEVAADQDPEFRDQFYRQWLPRLKREGRTLVVVSHDDRYEDVADRVVRFRDGGIAAITDRAEP
ncbi:MAG: cyclic peptide export ABC transporter [Azospirillaceae bacterium]